MMHMRTLCLWGLLGWTTTVGAQALRLVAPEYMPYTGEINGAVVGVGVDRVARIIERAGMTMTVHVVPNYSRCVFEVSHQIADGFFLGSRNAERDAVAVLSRPVMVNRWVWVLRKSSQADPPTPEFKDQRDVGVLLNTNPHVWLKEHSYRISGTPTSATSLLAMLDAGRFEAALVPELVFQHAAQQTGRNSTDYRTALHSSQAFGIYLSKDFLRGHPSALERINAAIEALAPANANPPRTSGKADPQRP
jgi:ABC-type amino acid transport substrate-binding protein